MIIDIYSDIVCPWCFIGKRQIEAAIAQVSAASSAATEPLRIVWRPFQLNPQIPPEGMSRKDYVVWKFGAARSKDTYARVTAVGAQHGIAFDFDRIERQPNTLAAHCLIAAAGNADDAALQSVVKEALMRAFFLDALDLTVRDNLVAVATAAGLERDAAERALDDAALRDSVALQERRARTMGVQGVPFFIFAGKLAVSGAQGAPALVEAMTQAAALAA